MGFKMKGMSFIQGQSPMKKVGGSQASEAKKVIARNTAGKDSLKYRDVADVSAVQEDKKGNKFVVSLQDNESYSGVDDNPVTTSRKTFRDLDFDIDRTAPRDTFMVSKNYPKGSLIDETEMETGKAQKKGFKPRKKNSPTKKRTDKTKEQLIKEGFTPADADKMIKDGATTGVVKAKKSKTSAHGQMNDAKEEYKQDKKMLANKKRKAKEKAKALKVTANQGDFKPAFAGADISASEYKKRMKDRKQPTFMGTDEYRKPQDIPASEYRERGLNKKTVLANLKKKNKK